jgi:hypothetical protein
LVARHPNYRRIKERACCRRYSREWGLVEANIRRGVFCVKSPVSCRAFAKRQRRLTPIVGENDMKDASRKAASGALAQVLALAAMLVIAGVVFYVR